MASSGIPIISTVASLFGGKTKEQELAERQMEESKKAMDRLDAERRAQEQKYQQDQATAAMKARRKQSILSTQGTGRKDTILTSPLGEVSSAAPTSKPSILGG
jgi:hypothetical protein